MNTEQKKQRGQIRAAMFGHAIGDALGVPVENISVKATTEEKLGFTGEGLGIAAHAVALLQ